MLDCSIMAHGKYMGGRGEGDIVGQLDMVVAAIYSELSLFIEMRCSIVFTDFTSLLQEHSLQDWGYVIRPIMSTQRKCNRVCAA